VIPGLIVFFSESFSLKKVYQSLQFPNMVQKKHRRRRGEKGKFA
jgi:hypothetical protein